MSKQKELAVKVMKLANEFSHWNFQIEQGKSSYFVKTALKNQKGQEITICYEIAEELAELQIISINSKYDYGFLQKKIDGLGLNYPVYAMGVGDRNISIVSPIPSELLDRYMAVIVRKRMVDMLDAMAEIIGFHKR